MQRHYLPLKSILSCVYFRTGRYATQLKQNTTNTTGFLYFADSTAGGIGIHADQAKVNMNIWLTPDDANLNKENGGLIIYDKAPPQEEVLGENFDKWNNDMYENDRMEWLASHNARNVSVPYRQNRCALFDSKRLHETDKYEFKDGYKNRRINLTLLFGREAPKDIQLTNNVEFV